ncbi:MULTISPECIES: hypothetical protein [Alteribacter]|uniref:Uncharacterized protein n=1 Tax=Alteribacter keqinensis TaxID=2483800 RepID=A0A3M7TUJ8_9BACI|nr:MULTISPECIES: hypothetical protein [Alteribacter]MBM7097336.1 hypothetical protein [Alteribacter salitolerans]RNA68931.1 hypothetical protein EBO34_02925 [Alteribacter keqinensis]
MIEVIVFTFFILLTGVAVGSLLTAKLVFSWQMIFTVTGLIFFFFVWIGMLLGGWLWFPDPLLKGLISFVSVILAVFFFRTYHPSFGYIPTRGLLHWGVLAVFFFFLGFEIGIAGFSKWFIVLFTVVFAVGVVSSAWLVWRLKNLMEFRFLVQYVPILLFVFIAVLKLV